MLDPASLDDKANRGALAFHYRESTKQQILATLADPMTPPRIADAYRVGLTVSVEDHILVHKEIELTRDTTRIEEQWAQLFNRQDFYFGDLEVRTLANIVANASSAPTARIAAWSNPTATINIHEIPAYDPQDTATEERCFPFTASNITTGPTCMPLHD